MKRLAFSLALFLLVGCERNFNALLSQARKELANKNDTAVIDDIHLALPRWRERDGADKKGEAYELLGKAYHNLRKLDQATDAYDEAIKISNNTYDAAYALGVMHLAALQYEQAKDAFQVALRMRRDDPSALLGLGDSLYNLKKFTEAKVVYRRIVDVSPAVNDALANLKLVDQKISEKERAEAAAKLPHRKGRR
jgi:tetratricopeptide (TPR) repeat protein